MQALIRSSRDGILLFGRDESFLVVNQTALELLRLPGTPEAWLGRPFGEALALVGREWPQVVAAAKSERARLGGGDSSSGEGEYQVGARSVHWLNLPVASLDAALGRLLVLRDVTEQRALERLREDLTSTMVHDLRNPLTAIGAVLEQLQSAPLASFTPGQREMLTIARTGADRLATLVSAILDVNRLESGLMPLAHERVRLSALVGETLALQGPLASERRLSLEHDVCEELPAAWADPALVARVLQNLVGNAIKFTPAGGRIRVSALLSQESQPMLQVAVSDDGPGLPQEMWPRLFQKFVSGGHKGRGSGLGLAFCRLAVEAHGGRIGVLSEPGRGATFTFTLPLAG
jgi:signal transduction histidine kinase